MKNTFKIKILKTVVLLISILFTLNALAQINVTVLENKVDTLFKDFSKPNHPGLTVGISQGDSIILIKAYGNSNLEKNTPITSLTRFHIASLTKQFTAYAIAQLEMDGKLSFQDDVRKYIPQLNVFKKVITIDHLLHHASGLRSSNRLRLLQDIFYETVLTQKSALDLIYAQKELNFEPGSDFSYSNSGYILLATIVENITKISFSDWLAQNVFQPLHMNHSLLVDDYSLIVPDRAAPYQVTDSGFEITMGMLWTDYGATGIYSTIEDLMKWQAYIHTQEYMWAIDEKSHFPYAMGLYIKKSSDGTTEEIFHTGDGVGYTAFMAYYPKEKLDVVLLSNLNNNEPIKLAERIIDFVRSKNENEISDTKNQLELPLEVLKKYEGSYDATQFKPEFEIKDKQLYALNPHGADLLVALNETTFSIPNTPVQFEFDKMGQYVILKMPGNDIKCPKIISEKVPDTVNLTDYVGFYYSPELEVNYALKIEDNKLVAYSPKNRRIMFNSVVEDITESQDRYFRNIYFSRDDNNNVDGLRVTDIDGRVRNLWFEKKK